MLRSIFWASCIALLSLAGWTPTASAQGVDHHASAGNAGLYENAWGGGIRAGASEWEFFDHPSSDQRRPSSVVGVDPETSGDYHVAAAPLIRKVSADDLLSPTAPVEFKSVPEPGTCALLGTITALLWSWRRLRRGPKDPIVSRRLGLVEFGD